MYGYISWSEYALWNDAFHIICSCTWFRRYGARYHWFAQLIGHQVYMILVVTYFEIVFSYNMTYDVSEMATVWVKTTCRWSVYNHLYELFLMLFTARNCVYIYVNIYHKFCLCAVVMYCSKYVSHIYYSHG